MTLQIVEFFCIFMVWFNWDDEMIHFLNLKIVLFEKCKVLPNVSVDTFIFII